MGIYNLLRYITIHEASGGITYQAGQLTTCLAVSIHYRIK